MNTTTIVTNAGAARAECRAADDGSIVLVVISDGDEIYFEGLAPHKAFAIAAVFNYGE